MIVVVPASAPPFLTEADVFNSFKVLTGSPRPDGESTGGAVVFSGGHAWVAEDFLRAQGDEAWRTKLDGMIAFARSRGWYEGGRIRAHVEQGPLPAAEGHL